MRRVMRRLRRCVSARPPSILFRVQLARVQPLQKPETGLYCVLCFEDSSAGRGSRD
jgi:hypothetical protein